MIEKLYTKIKDTELLEGLTIVIIILIAATAWLFLEIADEVIEGETHTFDKRIILAMRDADQPSDPWGPKWIEEIGRDLTALGGVAVLALIIGLCVGGLFIVDRRRVAYLIIFATFGGALLSFSLKSGFDRPRPDLVPHLSNVYSKSFPSGHAMISTVTYLTIGFLLASNFERKLLRTYIISASLLLAGLVGISRIYLGVHWPTDVIAGWAIGSSWALFCWLIGYWIKHKKLFKKTAA